MKLIQSAKDVFKAFSDINPADLTITPDKFICKGRFWIEAVGARNNDESVVEIDGSPTYAHIMALAYWLANPAEFARDADGNLVSQIVIDAGGDEGLPEYTANVSVDVEMKGVVKVRASNQRTAYMKMRDAVGDQFPYGLKMDDLRLGQVSLADAVVQKS